MRFVQHRVPAPLEKVNRIFDIPVQKTTMRLVHISVPELNGDPAHSGVAVLDPKTGLVEKVYDVGSCGPAGIALGPNQHLLLGCAQQPSVVINAKTGAIVATIPQVGGSDEVWYNPGDNRYYQRRVRAIGQRDRAPSA